MPELPEVETFRQYIGSTSLDRQTLRVDIYNDLIVRGTELAGLIKAVEGSIFISTLRHGKRLYLELSGGGWLTWHFGMTGRPAWLEIGESERFIRASFVFQEGSLAFVDPRMLGRLGLAMSPEEDIRRRDLGPDALKMKRDEFIETFHITKGPIKAALMNQRKVAGIGNLYSDEMLFQCRIDPRAEARSLSEGDLACLHRAMRRVLRASIEVGTDFERLPQTYLLRGRIRGATCPRCGRTLETITVGGRTSYLCHGCL